jgi:hypothetical protein
MTISLPFQCVFVTLGSHADLGPTVVSHVPPYVSEPEAEAARPSRWKQYLERRDETRRDATRRDATRRVETGYAML